MVSIDARGLSHSDVKERENGAEQQRDRNLRLGFMVRCQNNL